MKTSMMIVTPDMARKFLEGNNGNRPVRKKWVSEIARRIRDGEWRETHQGIAFDSDGNLLDGQHRLMAIVLANLPISIMVVAGFDIDNPMDFPADDMLKRSHSDSLRIPKQVAETAHVIARLVYGPCDVSTARVSTVLDTYQDSIEGIFHECNTTRKMKSSAPVRAAVAILSRIQDAEATLKNYRAFVLLEYENMPPSLLSLTRQIDGDQASLDKNCLFPRAYRAFDATRLSKQKVVVSDYASVMAEAREQARRAMGLL